MKREDQYDIQKYDDIKIPDGLQEAVKNGLAMGTQICKKRNRRKKIMAWGSMAAAVVIACSILISNPVLAAKIPIIGHVFEMLQDSYSYKGDFSSVATPLQEEEALGEDMVSADSAYTKQDGEITVSFSEVYCNNQAIYLALSMKCEEGFPDTFVDEDGNARIQVETTEDYSFNPAVKKAVRYLEGKMIDENTYVGILRISFDSGITTDDTEFDKYIEEIGEDVYEDMTDSELPENLIKELDVPDSFTLKLSINEIIGDKAEPDNIIDRTEEEQAAMSEEEWQKYVEENTPEDYYDYPNQYENYWFEGNWDFEIAISKDETKTQVATVNTTNEMGVGIESVEKTPFEIKLNEIYPDSGENYFPVALDADGEVLPFGMMSSANVFAIQDRDISTVYVYICDWNEYMDEIKGYYYSDDYEENKKEKTYKELLDERAVYSTEVHFQ